MFFQDTEPRESSSIFNGRAKKSWDQFDEYDSQELCCITRTSEKAKVCRLGIINAEVEDRSQEEIERQERCARGDAWILSKNICKLKEKDKATFYSHAEEWILPAAFIIKPDERDYVVDSGATMHKVSRKDLNFAELVKVRISKNPTTVVIANGELLTREEAASPECEKHPQQGSADSAAEQKKRQQ